MAFYRLKPKSTFSLSRDRKPELVGALDADIQYQPLLELELDLDLDEKSLADINGSTLLKKFNIITVNPLYSAVGNFLISSSFGPCMGVVAKLSDGTFAIFHASNPYNNFLKAGENKEDMMEDLDAGFSAFIDKIKDKVVDVYVFQKQNIHDKKYAQKNKDNAPILTLELTNALGIEAKCVKVDDYSDIVVDAKNNKIILTNELQYVKKAKQIVDSGTIIDVDNPATVLSTQDCIAHIENLKIEAKNRGVTESDGTGLFDVKIPTDDEMNALQAETQSRHKTKHDQSAASHPKHSRTFLDLSEKISQRLPKFHFSKPEKKEENMQEDGPPLDRKNKK
ncbi:MAG: hypothetical protein SFW66_03810 [Gammaproteobacteria bacterium]|nr:hypothetical protein [Gammaproteobacteria bacterium]